MSRIIPLFLVMLVFPSYQVNADSPELTISSFYDGNRLVAAMRGYDNVNTGSKENVDYMKASEFRGYVFGVVDATVSIGQRLYCLPQKADAQQIMAVVSKYLKAKPENWHSAAHLLVLLALQDAFPCK